MVLLEMLNRLNKATSNTDAPSPEEKVWENETLVDFLETYPHLSSMKNFRVLELIYDNKKLERDLAFVRKTRDVFDKFKQDDILILLNEIVKMSQYVKIENKELISKTASKHGYRVSEDGYLIPKGGLKK